MHGRYRYIDTLRYGYTDGCLWSHLFDLAKAHVVDVNTYGKNANPLLNYIRTVSTYIGKHSMSTSMSFSLFLSLSLLSLSLSLSLLPSLSLPLYPSYSCLSSLDIYIRIQYVYMHIQLSSLYLTKDGNHPVSYLRCNNTKIRNTTRPFTVKYSQ